jgi:hypothetical protein
MARSSSVPPSVGSSQTSRSFSSPAPVAGVVFPAPPAAGVFFPQTAQAVNNPGLQSPFMYAGFRAATSTPVYMGFGAQHPTNNGVGGRTAPHPTRSAFAAGRGMGTPTKLGMGIALSLLEQVEYITEKPGLGKKCIRQSEKIPMTQSGRLWCRSVEDRTPKM